MKIILDSFRWNVVTAHDASTRALMMKDEDSGLEVHVLLAAEDARKLGTKLVGADIKVAKSGPKGIVGHK